MATEVLRPHNVLLVPSPAQRIRATTHQRATATNQGAARTKAPTPAAGRRHLQGKSKRTAAARHAAAVEVYAGPAFSVSPEPSSLPLPQFPFRKAAAAAVDDAATRDLRRMLRLE